MRGGSAIAVVASVVAIVAAAGATADEHDGGCGGSTKLRAVEHGHGRGSVKISGTEGFEKITIHARVPANRRGEAYEVWLYESRTDAESVGAARVGRRGKLDGTGRLPAPLEAFDWIDISVEKIDSRRGHSGRSVLRARIADLCR